MHAAHNQYDALATATRRLLTCIFTKPHQQTLNAVCAISNPNAIKQTARRRGAVYFLSELSVA